MGANAQTAVPVFTAGQVLTAQQQTEINTGIPVFATTVTRDAAFGGTGEKTLAEGQFAYIEATNTTQYYDGATWQSVVPAGGLTLVTSASGSAAASIIIDNCFTSTYENYRILFVGKTSADTFSTIQLRVGGVAAATNYATQTLNVAGTGVTAARLTAQTSARIFASNSDDTNAASIDIFKPNLAIGTSYNVLNTYLSGTIDQYVITGRHSTATAYDGFAVTPLSGTITATIYVYGYSK